MSGANSPPNVAALEKAIKRLQDSPQMKKIIAELDHFFANNDTALKDEISAIDTLSTPSQDAINTILAQCNLVIDQVPIKIYESLEAMTDGVLTSNIEDFSQQKALLQGMIAAMVVPITFSTVFGLTYSVRGEFDARPAMIAALLQRTISEVVKQAENYNILALGAMAFLLMGSLHQAINGPPSKNPHKKV